MIPLHTTTITVRRLAGAPVPASQSDPYEEPAQGYSVTAAGVRAVLSVPSAVTTRDGGSREETTWRLSCDLAEVAYLDRITDESTGEEYEVVWARERAGERGDLAHVEGVVRQVRGQV